MFYCNYGLCCNLCSCFIAPKDLKVHLSKRKEHSMTPTLAEAASVHILAMRCALPDEDILLALLTEEIPALGKPFVGYKCPDCPPARPIWVSQDGKFAHKSENSQSEKAKSFYTHGRLDHRWKNLPDDLKLRHFYRPYGHQNRRPVVAFEEGWEPIELVPSTERPETATVTDLPITAEPTQGPVNRRANYLSGESNFIKDMGFDAYLTKTNRSKRRIRQLVKLPNSVFAGSRASGRQKALEQTLVLLSNSLEDYLLEAREFAGEDGSDIREAFVNGYVLLLFLL